MAAGEGTDPLNPDDTPNLNPPVVLPPNAGPPLLVVAVPNVLLVVPKVKPPEDAPDVPGFASEDAEAAAEPKEKPPEPNDPPIAGAPNENPPDPIEPGVDFGCWSFLLSLPSTPGRVVSQEAHFLASLLLGTEHVSHLQLSASILKILPRLG